MPGSRSPSVAATGVFAKALGPGYRILGGLVLGG